MGLRIERAGNQYGHIRLDEKVVDRVGGQAGGGVGAVDKHASGALQGSCADPIGLRAEIGDGLIRGMCGEERKVEAQGVFEGGFRPTQVDLQYLLSKFRQPVIGVRQRAPLLSPCGGSPCLEQDLPLFCEVRIEPVLRKLRGGEEIAVEVFRFAAVEQTGAHAQADEAA